jgi:hypothetical protein
MVEFYEAQSREHTPAHGWDRVLTVELTERYTTKYTALLCIPQHVALLMCGMHRESEFKTNKPDPIGDSYGVGQVRKKYNAGLRRYYLKSHGIRLGKDTNLETQVAFSVAMFKFKLDACKGNAYEAVRAYNGKGPGARHHRKKVISTLRRIYGLDLRPDGRYVKWKSPTQKGIRT